MQNTPSIQLIVEDIVFNHKISMVQFAKECGVSKPTLYRVMHAKSVSPLTATKILRYYCFLLRKAHLRSH